MKKMDLHIHTVSTKRDKPFAFSIEKLKGYVIQEKVDLIAITNHNLFDAQQFSDITNALPIKVFPGIEVDIEGGHLIVITDPSDIDDFTEKCAKVYRLNETSEDSYISEAQFMEIFNDLGKYILIPHYEKEPKLPLERVPQISPYIKCGEACSAKKFIYMQSRSEKLVPVLFSDWRVEEKAQFPLGRQTYVNSLITSVKKELSVRSSTTAVPDIDLYQILMNQHKVQVFHDVVKMIKKPRVIQAQNLYSYRVVAQSSPFSGALAMQKVSRSKTVFSDAFKEYNDPYKFLQVLKGKDIPASEYYKYFVNITYEVFNQYGSPASGGERSEYNLLQELSDGVKNSILILDEPESSFDNIFLRDGVDSLLKDISKTIPVIIATHNNTIGVSVHPDYIVYACKEVLSDGKLEYHLYSGYPSSEDLVDLKGNHISRKSVLLDCLEAGEAAYMDRRNSYEILNG